MSEYFLTKAKNAFPEVAFTGGGAIHASLGRQGTAPLDWDKKRLIMKSLKETEFPGLIYRTIIKQFPNMEWLMTPEEFDDLILVDYYRLLNGMATSETKSRLTNPSTGNKFHRITLVPDHDMVGGVRVWIHPVSQHIGIGFRFRLESLYGESEHKKVRQKAAAQVLELEAEVTEIKEYVKEEAGESVVLENYVNF